MCWRSCQLDKMCDGAAVSVPAPEGKTLREAWDGVEVEPLISCADGVAIWPETATAVGVRDTIEVVAPNGLRDLFGMICRRNPRRVTRDEYHRRIQSKPIATRWPGVLVLRSATSQDIDSVLNLWRVSGGPSSVSDTPDGVARLLTRDPDALLIAESGGVPVGSLIAAWDGWRGSFYKLVVHPERRRQGLATELLREGERCLRARRTVRLTATVTDSDTVAVGFWTAAGYASRTSRHGSCGSSTTDPPRCVTSRA
jgi:ribosomal protein S18 acetylase RimI-like enzyme